jgi:hypothetical protein
MRVKSTRDLLKKVVIVVTLLIGYVAMTTPVAEAQRRHRRVVVRPRVFVYSSPFYSPFYRPFGYSRYYFPAGRVTEGQGYRDGLNDGEDDAEDGKGYRPQSHNDYKNAMTSAYLDGYRRGYDEGYRNTRG